MENVLIHGLNFIIKGYNVPFTIHTSPDDLAELENKYGISIEEGDVIKPFIAPFPYKYTSEKQRRIDQIQTIINNGKNDNHRLVKISSFSYNMLHDLESLTQTQISQSIITQDEVPTKDNKRSYIDTTDDPCI